MKYIKKHPWGFVSILIITSSYLLITFQRGNDVILNVIYAICNFLLFYFMFISTSKEEEINDKIDDEIKRLRLSREHLYQVTGYNRFEITTNEQGKTIFWISLDEKKKLLKQLKSMAPNESNEK